MIKLIEYAVITRPFYREQPPILHRMFAENEEDAADTIFKRRDVKEILDVKLYAEITWNDEIKEKYWLLYK